MYSVVLSLHSWVRWLALLGAVLAVVVGWRGLLGKAPWTRGARRASLLFVIGFDLQLVLGAILTFTSPITSAAFANMKVAMRDPQLRFWAVEHGPMMVVAVILAHVGNVLVKKAPTDAAKYKRLAVFATLALLLVLVSIPWPGRITGRPLFR